MQDDLAKFARLKSRLSALRTQRDQLQGRAQEAKRTMATIRADAKRAGIDLDGVPTSKVAGVLSAKAEKYRESIQAGINKLSAEVAKVEGVLNA